MKFKMIFVVTFLFMVIIQLTAGYDPNIGRFLKRDKIEEKGGINLYIFVSNNSISNIDFLGMGVKPDIPEGDVASAQTAKEYFEEWKQRNPNRNKGPNDKYDKMRMNVLKHGCVGIILLETGSIEPFPDTLRLTKNCYKNIKAAKAAMKKATSPEGSDVNKQKAKYILFAIHLWNDNPQKVGNSTVNTNGDDVTFKNEKADLSKWDWKANPNIDKTLNPAAFDFGLLKSDRIIHANQGELGNRPEGSMRVYHSKIDSFTARLPDKDGVISYVNKKNFNIEVWCFICNNNKER